MRMRSSSRRGLSGNQPANGRTLFSRARAHLRCRVLKDVADIRCCSIARWPKQLLVCDTSARDVIRAHDPVYVDVDDPGILEDIDDPASYARLQECGR